MSDAATELTVGKLRELIHHLPDEAPVIVTNDPEEFGSQRGYPDFEIAAVVWPATALTIEVHA